MNDELLLHILKTSAQFATHYMLLEMLYAFNLCVVVELTVIPTNGSPVD